MSIYRDRYTPKYLDGFGANAEGWICDRSKEIASILNERGFLVPGGKVFEIGGGGGLNLQHIRAICPDMQFTMNDLYRDASLAVMDPGLRDVVEFIELDTLALVRTQSHTDIDVFLSIDHLMHLDRDTADEVIRAIECTWRPKVALFRECKKHMENTTRSYPRIYHNVRLKGYDLVFDGESSINKGSFYIRIFRRCDDVENIGG